MYEHVAPQRKRRLKEEEIRSRGGGCDKHSIHLYTIKAVTTQRMKLGFMKLYIKIRAKPLKNKGYVLFT